MSISHLVSAIRLGLLVGCAVVSLAHPTSATTTADLSERADDGSEVLPWAAPSIDRAVTVFDGRTGEILTFDEMLDKLAAVDAVFLGETHIDETTHRVELAVYEGLLKRRDGEVVLALEMFERDVQPVLDAYLAGEIEENDFIKQARAWGQYRSAYRPMIERAREDGLSVIASNFPRPLTRRIAMEGLSVLDTLKGDERAHAPAEIFPNSPEYWKRVDNAVRGHLAMMRRGGADDQRLTSTQTLWDNAMGESCVLALDAHPGSMVLHVNGGFHSMYWDGTVRQFLLRKPDARALTVAVYSTRNPSVSGGGGTPVADFVVMAETRAMDKNEGTWSVVLDRELDYRFHLPKSATKEKPVPLLIWFGEAGLNSEDGMELWKDRLGDDAAIVVVEQPYRARFDDLSSGGRWYWADTAAEDVGSLISATERIWAYLMRYYPIDPERVSVAGEGTGATVVAAIALLGDRMDHKAMAFDPRHYAKLKDYPLPLPEYNGESDRAVSLKVSGSAGDESWWQEELVAYRGVGLETLFVLRSDAGRDVQQEAALRVALGLSAEEIDGGAESVSMMIPTDTPRARHWSRLYALRHTAETGQVVTLIDADAAGYSGNTLISLSDIVHPSTIGDSIPRCPGPFGGTTVLVLPPDLPAADVKAWIALEDNDPLNKASRFHRLRIAVQDADAAERALPKMLETLEGEGRKNVLIVPAVFCADPGTMQMLERQTRDVANRMTIQWLPGLGGEKLPVDVASVDAEIGTVEHELQVVLEPATGRLAVEDTITLPPAVRGAGAEFTLNSALMITKSEPAVRKIGVLDSKSGPEQVRYALESAAPEGMLRIAYEGTMDFGLSDQKEEYARGFRETHGTVGPEGVFLNGGSAWIVQFADEMIRFTVEIEAPNDWHVISQGNGNSDADGGAGDTRIARWSSGADLEQVYLVGGPLMIEREMAGNVEVLVYLHEPDEALARKYLDATARYIEMYRKLIGPYPYDKFALVENFWETGYGMPSFTLLGEQVIRLPFILHSSYPHEILHNWWGNSVFVDYESGNWCEGLTAYMADHLIQEQRGKGSEYRRSTLQKFRDYVKEGRDFPLTEFRSRHSAATEAVGYGKALMTYHMLRLRVGDDAFRAAFTDFYRKNRGERASFDDIRASFESVTGEDLSQFFYQWIQRSGAPSLVVRDVESEPLSPNSRVYIVSGTIEQTQADDLFVLSVPIVVLTDEGQESVAVEMDSREEEFTFSVNGKPAALAIDPAFDIFRLLSPLETPSSIGQIFGEPEVLAIIPSGDGEDVDAYIALMEGWATDDHAIEIVRDDEVKSLPSDRAVWVLGSTNRFAAGMLDFDLQVNAGEPVKAVSLGGTHVSVADHSLIVIRRHPGNPEKAIGWISVAPGAAFPGVGRKLPHYGKYSYLAFEGDEPTNIVKGQWEATDSPLVYEFVDNGSASLSLESPAALAELPPVFSQRVLREHVAWLAAPERQGRGLGTYELTETAEYIARQFADAGLVPGGDDGSWYQRFTVANGPDGKPVDAVNVVGILPGKRADWSDQSIVLGAHYDHLGLGWPDVHSGDEGKVHAGADDNASGVAVMIEVARNLVAEGGGSRNLVVVAFSGEEAGLKGSKHYVANPRFPVAGMRGVINLDTVGRLNDGEIAIHATGTADEWQHIFRGVGFVTGIKSRNVAARVGGSDQDSFINVGVPAVQFFTGVHSDYHRPSDTADKVDSAGLVKVATFVKESLAYILEREEPMNVRIDGVATAPKAGHRPAEGGRRVSFGTVPNFEFAGPGVKVDSVVQGSPAERAGLQAGDVLIKLDSTDISDLRAFSQHLRTLKPGQEVLAVVIRDGTEVEIPVRVEAR